MNDLKIKIDRLQKINAEIDTLKNEKSVIEATIIKQCSGDLENTKLKSKHYIGVDAELTATNSESLKITYSTFLPFIFGEAYKDAVTETTAYKLSAPATRMIIGMWQGDYIRSTVTEVINQITSIAEDDRKQLIKKCKGKNYKNDIAILQKFAGFSYEDAADWAFPIAEADVWQSFMELCKLNNVDVNDENAVNEIISKIRAAFVVDETTKITFKRLGE